MPKITALFWDVGGVLLTNAWDHKERLCAMQQFGVDEVDFNDRHQMLVAAFELGNISLDEYLDRTIFYRSRAFSKDAFKDYMFSLSHPKPEVLALARSLARAGKYFMATLNNESRELNLYRIKTFNFTEVFSLFVSSCFVAFRKPEEGIYRLALDITQRLPGECCFIDDRAINLECAVRMGMHVIQMKTVDQLRADLADLGVAV